MVKDNNLGIKGRSLLAWVVLIIGADITSFDIFDRDISDGETDIVTWGSKWQLFVMHLDGLAFRGKRAWGEFDDHSWFQQTGLNSTDWDRTDTGDLEDVVDWKSQWLVGWSDWGSHSVEGSDKGSTFVPWHVVLTGLGLFGKHVLAGQTGEWNEGDLVNLVTGFLQESGSLFLNFLISVLGVVDRWVIHLVDTDTHLFNTEGESKKSMFSGLAVFGDTSLELTSLGGDHQD